MEGYQKFTLNCGVVGVCTTGRNRYADMAKMGDYLMVDIYPRETVLSVDYYFQKALKDAAGKPVWQLNQGYDYDYSNRDPKTMIPNPAMLNVRREQILQLPAAVGSGENDVPSGKRFELCSGRTGGKRKYPECSRAACQQGHPLR